MAARSVSESACILRRVIDLPVIPAEPTCPAASKVTGVSYASRGVVCRVMLQDQQDDPGIRMSAGQLGKLRETEGGAFISAEHDPSTLVMLCHGDAVPVTTDEDGDGRASYTYCPVWQTARKRALAGLDGLTDDPEPEPVSMGVEEPVASHQAPDPWAAGLAGLDELAPTPAWLG